MKELELYIPGKPFNVTQAWGIYNPAYKQFGFSKHNGIDFKVDDDYLVRAMCDGVVTEVGYNSGAGNFVRYRTNEKVMCEGTECYVYFIYMHATLCLVKHGDKIKAGDPLIIAGNTGFSTGPHTHISAYRVGDDGSRLDKDVESNYTFDFSKYFNGFYADHAKAVELFRYIPAFKQLQALMRRIR